MNIKPANRIANVEEYYFSKKLEEIRNLKALGKDIINLGIGNPDIAPHPQVLETLAESSLRDESNGYQSYRGLLSLRKSIALWYLKIFNIKLNPESEILPLMGSKEGIMHISMAFTNPGDQVLIPNPGYPAYTSVSKLLNLDIQYYGLTERNYWMPDIMELNKIVKPTCKILWLNYPHMPTGAVADIKTFELLTQWAQSKNILIVHDNPYSLILNDKPLSILGSNNRNVLELNSLSKSHNMAGWRIGMVVGSKKNINHILQVKSNFDSGMYKPIQEAAIQALQLPENWYKQQNETYEKRRKIVWKILDKLKCSYNKKSAGLFAWAKVSSDFNNGEELSDFLLYTKSVFITPGSVFGSNGDKYIRISLCANEQILKETLNRVATLKLKVA